MALPPFLDVKAVEKNFGIKPKKLKLLRDSRQVIARRQGKRFMHVTSSVEAYTLADCSKLNLNKIYDDTVIKKEVGQPTAINKSPDSANETGGAHMWTQSLKKRGWQSC